MGAAVSTDAQSGDEFFPIRDKYKSVRQVSDAIRQAGVESCNLIIAVDFTKSNEWAGQRSFHNLSLHDVSAEVPNPYEQAIGIVGKTLRSMDEDGLIPCFGFGDASTHDRHVFSFNPDHAPCQSLEHALARYREIAPFVKLAGPTSFAPAVEMAASLVQRSGNNFHILLLIADGQVTRSADTDDGRLSAQEQATVDAIVRASEVPLAIVMVGVGDGPWHKMQEFDDKLPQRRFDNFQFVELAKTLRGETSEEREAQFALQALMEVPAQYKQALKLGLLGAPSASPTRVSALPPPPHVPPPSSFCSSSCARASAPPPSASLYPEEVPGARYSAAEPPRNRSGEAMPPEFFCPITQELMRDPVCTSDGHTFEREAIAHWLRGSVTSPLTGARLESAALIPNHSMRNAIEAFAAS